MKKGLLYRICDKVVQPHNQFIAVLITTFFILVIGYYGISGFNPKEIQPDLLPITPEKIKEWRGSPIIVHVGLYINSWQNFDVVKNEFVFDGVIWFQFDPARMDLDTISQFSFEKGEIVSKSDPETKLIDSKLHVEYKIRVNFTSTLNQRAFPLDDHQLFIVLVNTTIEPRTAVFRSFKSGFRIDNAIQTPGWVNVNRSVEAGYEEKFIIEGDAERVIRYPKIVFILDFYRSGISLIMLILLPIFLIFFISLFSLGYDPKENSRLIFGLASSSLTSLVAYRFVITALSPKVGYFLISDKLFTCILVLLFFVFVICAVIIREGKLTPLIVVVRGLTFISFHLLLVMSWYYFLIIGIKT